MKKLLIPVILFLWVGISGFTPEKSSKELRGDKYFFVYSYNKAIDSYTKADQLSMEGQRHLAESYHQTAQDSLSEAAYSKLISSASGVMPEDYYNYAMLLKSTGKYEESGRQMDKFRELAKNDLRSKSYADNKGKLAAMRLDDGKYKTEHLNINTEAEDFGPCYYKNKIVFSSSRATKLAPKKYNWNGKPFLDMYVSEMDGSQLKDPQNFDKSLNGKLHDGTASFSKDGNYMAFTRNNYDTKRKDKVIQLEICFSKYASEKWTDPQPFALNSKDYSVGHPCLSADGNTLYFTSDMPGGYGGADLYRVSRNEKGEWGKQQNLGAKVNTEGDELFPFFEEKNSVLFFTSNGRFGLGGLDIFMCIFNGTEFGKAYNAGAPLNTQYDDFAVIVDEKISKGYFSSNRAGGSGDDDIYAFDFLKALEIGKAINGIAKNKKGEALPGTFITFSDDKGNLLDTLTTKDDGAYSFFADTDKRYKLSGNKQAYLQGDTLASTFGKEFIVKADLLLLKEKEAIEQHLQVNADLARIVSFNPIYFDFHEYVIRPDAETELEKIVKIMNEYPNMVIELKAHTDCRATKEYNQVLSDKRAKASADYIMKRITKPGRISYKGYGETMLLNGCSCEGDGVSHCTDEEHQQNRRTEFIILKK